MMTIRRAERCIIGGYFISPQMQALGCADEPCLNLFVVRWTRRRDTLKKFIAITGAAFLATACANEAEDQVEEAYDEQADALEEQADELEERADELEEEADRVEDTGDLLSDAVEDGEVDMSDAMPEQ